MLDFARDSFRHHLQIAGRVFTRPSRIGPVAGTTSDIGNSGKALRGEKTRLVDFNASVHESVDGVMHGRASLFLRRSALRPTARSDQPKEVSRDEVFR